MSRKYYRKEYRQSFYREKFAEQGGCCKICGRADRLVIDHNHLTGDIRGLVCYKHNTGLGMFEDSPELLRAAAKYLEEAEAKPPSTETSQVVLQRAPNVSELILELLADPTFTSDRARARELMRHVNMTESAAQARVSRTRKRIDAF